MINLYIRSIMQYSKLYRHYTSTVMNLWHPTEIKGMLWASAINSDNGMHPSTPAGPNPVKLRVNVPRKKLSHIQEMFDTGSADEGTYKKHFVGDKAFSENMVQYVKSSDVPESPQGEQGFLWRLTRPVKAFRKRFLRRREEFVTEPKNVEPVKAAETANTNTKDQVTPPAPKA